MPGSPAASTNPARRRQAPLPRRPEHGRARRRARRAAAGRPAGPRPPAGATGASPCSAASYSARVAGAGSVPSSSASARRSSLVGAQRLGREVAGEQGAHQQPDGLLVEGSSASAPPGGVLGGRGVAGRPAPSAASRWRARRRSTVDLRADRRHPRRRPASPAGALARLEQPHRRRGAAPPAGAGAARSASSTSCAGAVDVGLHAPRAGSPPGRRRRRRGRAPAGAG